MFNPHDVRPLFPALNQEIEGALPVFLDGPGGTQVPESVLESMAGYLGFYNSNLLSSPFFAVQNTWDVLRNAREYAACFVNASPENIVFGANMSSLTAHVSRSISREWQEGDEIIVTDLDHYANVSFWVQAAADRGVTVHRARIRTEDCTLDYEHLESLISKKTKLVALTLASNLCGSRVDAARVIQAAKAAGALTYVDSVHAAPHFLPDVQALDCDFLACSSYKFFGPHYGLLYGRGELLERFKPYKVAPADPAPPECWETGTKNFEALAGMTACIDYLASLGEGDDLRQALESAYAGIQEYEQNWSKVFLERAAAMKSMNIRGIDDPDRVEERSPTFAFTIEGQAPQAVSDHLAAAQIATGAGHFYAVGITDTLDMTESGVVRAGCVHYNTLEELDRLFGALDQLA